MKNGLFRFYLLFMVMSLALFSCENHEITNQWGSSDTGIPSNIQRRPEGRHPEGPNDAPTESQKSGKRPRRQYNARSSNWC